MQLRGAHLLNAKDEVGHVDQLLQRAEAVAVARARGRLKAAAHDAAADVNVRGRCILIRQPQRILERPDLVGLIAPAQPQRCLSLQAQMPHGSLDLHQASCVLPEQCSVSCRKQPGEDVYARKGPREYAELIIGLHVCAAKAGVCCAYLRGVLPGGTTLSK